MLFVSGFVSGLICGVLFIGGLLGILYIFED